MSDPQTSLSYELLVCSDPMMLPVPIHRGPDLVYEELNRLAELMPQRYADVFRFRWGLTTHFPHLTSQTARKFEIPQSTADVMLERCLWNVARYAHTYELPAVRALVGEEPGEWAARGSTPIVAGASMSRAAPRPCCCLPPQGWMCVKRTGVRSATWSTSGSGGEARSGGGL